MRATVHVSKRPRRSPPAPPSPPPALAGLAPRDARLLMTLARRLVLPAGRRVFSEGDPAAHFYLVESGGIRVFYHSVTGREPTIARCGAGDLFGLAEISAGGRRVASAEAAEPSVVWVFRSHDLGRITRRLPGLAHRIIHALSSRLRSVTLLMESIVTLPVRLRVANFLLAHAQPGAPARGPAVTGGWTHEDIADMLVCTRQTVTETLNEFVRASLVRVERKRIVVVDPRRLEDLAATGRWASRRGPAAVSASRQTHPRGSV